MEHQIWVEEEVPAPAGLAARLEEAVNAALDAEGVDFRRHLRIIPFRPARRGVFHAREYRTGERRRFFVRYLLHPGFVLTWAAE